MSNVGKEVKAVVEAAMLALNTVEQAHELYGLSTSGSVEGFYAKFDDKERKIQSLINAWTSPAWMNVGKVIMDRFTESSSIVRAVNDPYAKFIQLPLGNADDLSRKMADLEQRLSSNKVVGTPPPMQGGPFAGNMGFGGPSLGGFMGGLPGNNMAGNFEPKYVVEGLINDVAQTAEATEAQARRVMDPNAIVALRISALKNVDVSDGKDLRMILNDMKSILDEFKRFAQDFNAVAARIQDRSFDKFVATFASDSTDDMKKKIIQDVHIAKSSVEIKQEATLENLYSGSHALEGPLGQALEATVDAVKQAAKPFLMKKGDVSKRINADIAALQAAMDLVKPSNHKSPNFSVNRGPRFVWTEVRARLDAIMTTYATSTAADALDAMDPSLAQQGFFYRQPDLDRLNFYLALVTRFQRDITADAASGDGAGDAPTGNLVARIVKAKDGLQERTMASITDANKLADELEREQKEDPAYVHHQRQRLARKKQVVIEMYLREVKRILNGYMQLHVDFALKANRQGMRYIAYWKGVEIANDEARGIIDAYESTLVTHADSVAHLGERMVGDLRKALLVEFFAKNAGDIVRDMDADMAEKINDKFNDVDEWAVDTILPRVTGIHAGPPTIFDVMSDPQIFMLYALKCLRFGFMVLALALARRSFQAMYNERVYNRNADPPHPALMIAMFLGIELGFAVICLLLLYFLKYLFYHGPGTFFIDKYVLSRWLLDYIASTLVISATAFIMSDVVRQRKYFRYRYEGERGIRALESMVRWTSGVLLCLPFYRLAD